MFDVPGLHNTKIRHVLDDYNATDLCLLVLYTMVPTDNIN